MRLATVLRGILPVLAALWISGCATNPATGEKDFVLMSEQKEIKIGHEASQEVAKQYRTYNDDELQAYVSLIGQRLAALSHRPGIEYHFQVVDSDVVNAFALPGGWIYVSRGLLAYLNTEAELAAVIGHEIGHVTARHSVQQHSQGMMSTVGSTAATILGGSYVGQAASYAGAALTRGYGREMELEADRLGAEYLARAGYSPDSMIDVVRVLKHQEEFEIERAKAENRDPRVYHGVFSTHPDQDTRLQEIIESVSDYATHERQDNRALYLAKINGLAFGPKGSEGVMRGNTFYHSGLGTAMKFPPGWQTKNYPDRLLIVAPHNSATIEVRATPLPNATLSPHRFMMTRVQPGALEDGESFLTEDGYEGYTAIAPNTKSPYGNRSVRYSVVYANNFVYVFSGAAKNKAEAYRYDPYFVGSAKSLRELEEEEYDKARPVQIQIVSAGDGTTIEQLAEGAPIPRYSVQQHRLINDLYPDGEPKTGDLVKIIR